MVIAATSFALLFSFSPTLKNPDLEYMVIFVFVLARLFTNQTDFVRKIKM